MQALCDVVEVLRIVVDEKNSSRVRHDNHLFGPNGLYPGFRETLMRQQLGYAHNEEVSIS